MHDPRDPALQHWLRSLKPRVELTARYALRAKFPAIRADAGFSARIAELLRQLQPSDADLAAILRDAQLVGQAFQERDPDREVDERAGNGALRMMPQGKPRG